jgi:DNA polymerase III gamma/tau subunit
MKLKHSEKVIVKANNLLKMNHEVEKIYIDAHDIVDDEKLKSFFRELAFERNEFSKALQRETIKLGEAPQNFEGLNKLSRAYHIIWKNLRPLLKQDNTPELLDQICSIKEWSIDNYNNLLQEFNLSLSLCKLLVEQRDLLHSKMNRIKVNEALTV